MIQKGIMKILLLVFLLQLVTGCKDNATGPKPEPFKNPREMIWTADTLKLPDYAIQLLPLDLLVISQENVWLAAEVGHGQVYHYDGKTWEMVKEIGGGIDCLVEDETKNKIWVGGFIGREVEGQFTQNSYIGYYNGTNWQDTEFNIRSEILDLTKDANDKIWACGRNGLVMKYENNKWNADTVKVGYLDTHANSEYLLRSIVPFNNKIHMLGGIYDSNLKRYVNYHFKGEMNNWELLDSMIVDSPSSIIKWGDLGLFTNSKKLYSYGSLGIWEYLNNTWQKVYDFDGEMYDVYNISDNYMMAVSAFNTVLFYNGQVWENISDIFATLDPTFVFNNVWTDGYEIIITGYGKINNKQGTIVWHGK